MMNKGPGELGMTKARFDEPALDELLADPMIDLVMRRDGFDAEQVRRTMEGAWRRLRLSRAGRDADAGDRVLPTGV
jgi:hypothetical protein